MKAISLALVVIAVAVSMTGCANLRTRSAPARACLTNPCGGFAPCASPCALPQQPMMPPPTTDGAPADGEVVLIA